MVMMVLYSSSGYEIMMCYNDNNNTVKKMIRFFLQNMVTTW